MKDMNRAKKRSKLAAAIIVMLLLICLCVSFLITQSREPANNSSIENAIESSGEKVREAVPHETLVFASDYQDMSGWDKPSATLEGVLEQIKSADIVPTNVINCGIIRMTKYCMTIS